MTPVAIVAGSGISIESVFDGTVDRIPFNAFPGLPRGSVPGHGYAFLRGTCGDQSVILQCGRLHCYEGLDPDGVARTVDVLYEYGARTILFIAAAGGLKPELGPGDLIAIERIRLWRYVRWHATPGMLFTDFTMPGCDLLGTYQWVHGPSYETRAEIAAIQSLKADAVGMSTAPELARCHELGVQAALVACVTNSCCRPGPLTHTDVVATARRASDRLAGLVRAWLGSIPVE